MRLRKYKLRRNLKLVPLINAFRNLRTLNAVVVLFLIHRGVSIDQVFYLSLIWSITALVSEVPSGYLADKIGRKKTMYLGAVVLLFAWIIKYNANGYSPFIIIFILMSLSFSIFSGTEEALLYDSLKELKRENKMTRYTGLMNAANHFIKIFVPTLGALLARNLLESQFKTLVIVDIFAAIATIILVNLLIEPHHKMDVSEREKNIFKDSIDIIKSEPFILKANLNRILLFISSFIIWRAYQPFITDKGISVLWLSIFYLLLQTIFFLFNYFAEKIEKLIGLVNILSGTVYLSILTLILVLVFGEPWVIYIALLLTIGLQGGRATYFPYLINKRIKSFNRATTLSNLNVIKSFFDIPVLLITGRLALIDIRYVFVMGMILCLITLISFPIRKSDIV